MHRIFEATMETSEALSLPPPKTGWHEAKKHKMPFFSLYSILRFLETGDCSEIPRGVYPPWADSE
jgi:hypothetical protein